MINVRPTPAAALAAFRCLYEEFVVAGDLVFDIGANIGENTELFAGLGARVVAVEPLEECAAAITRYAEDSGLEVQVERCAIGAEPGTLELAVCSRALDTSSASPEWIQAMRAAGACSGPWDRRVLVEMETLDALILRHGAPNFIKIDVEGFEAEVLAGLSQRVGGISLETHRATLDTSLVCLGRLQELGFTRFAVSAGHTATLSPWMPASAAAEAMARLDWGDLYAR